MGKKIYSYSRRASARSDVERRGEVDTSVNEEEEDAVIFEVYHVRYSIYCEASGRQPCRQHGKPLAFWNITDECNYSYCYTLKLAAIFKRMKTNGNLLSCALAHHFAVHSSHSARFERRKRKDGQYVYHFVGYSSLYPFYYYPNSTRMRLRCSSPFLHVVVSNPPTVSL